MSKTVTYTQSSLPTDFTSSLPRLCLITVMNAASKSFYVRIPDKLRKRV
ncbi:hypothetical protein O9929_18620 [Vibrio lentus]|nr:hypothetical protein [Vibrio lentus]